MKKHVLLFICLTLLSNGLISTGSITSQTLVNQNVTSFEARFYEHEGKALPYGILLPKNFDTSKKYPLHLFLHGSGERGDDNEAQFVHGGLLFQQMNKQYPAIVIFPQCPAEDYWAQISYDRDQETNENIFHYPEVSEPTWAMDAVIHLLDKMLLLDYVDKQQIYLGGLSMGGMGTFELLARRPNVFAAATPICGGGQPNHVSRWASNTPVWIFHGDDDTVVPSIYSKIMVEALLENGNEPKFSLYPSVNHNSWDNAFAEPDLFSWIYSQKKATD